MLKLLVVVKGFRTSETSSDVLFGQEHFVTFVTPMCGATLFKFVLLIVQTGYVNKIGTVFN